MSGDQTAHEETAAAGGIAVGLVLGIFAAPTLAPFVSAWWMQPMAFGVGPELVGAASAICIVLSFAIVGGGAAVGFVRERRTEDRTDA